MIYFLENKKPVADWCRENDVPYVSVLSWLNKGYLVEDACQFAKEGHEKRKLRKTIMLGEKTLSKSVSQKAYNTIIRYINNKGLSVEKAIKLYEKRKGKNGNRTAIKHIPTGKIFPTIRECSNYFKIPYEELRYRATKFQGFERIEVQDD